MNKEIEMKQSAKPKQPAKPKSMKCVGLKRWQCEIVGHALKIEPGKQVNLTQFEYKVLADAGVIRAC